MEREQIIEKILEIYDRMTPEHKKETENIILGEEI